MKACYHSPDQKPEEDLEVWRQIREASKRGRFEILRDFSYPHIDTVNSCSWHEKRDWTP